MLAEFDFRILADVNATLNSIALVLIISGLIAIKNGRETLHKRSMLTAAGVSALFLVSYVTYHATCPPVKFGHDGPIRCVFFVILISHICLAAVQVPMIISTIVLGLIMDGDRRYARLWSLVFWALVVVTLALILPPLRRALTLDLDYDWRYPSVAGAGWLLFLSTRLPFLSRSRRSAHRRLAKVTAPIWLYVSITGVIVYVMLYHT